MDERDDREPLFYTRQLVADFEPESVSRAFASEDPGQPFGFEYVPSATFREMNFGRLDEQESPTAFAGEVMPRKGFSVCRRCGGVQMADGEVQHTVTCGASGSQSIDGLFVSLPRIQVRSRSDADPCCRRLGCGTAQQLLHRSAGTGA